MRQSVIDLSKVAAYLIAAVVLLGSLVGAATAAFHNIHETPIGNWISTSQEASREATRLSTVVAHAREIREALARPIPGPERLQPITAKLAYGHLKPGGNGVTAITVTAQRKVSKISNDAIAMDMSSSFRASSAVRPDLHKVY